MSDSPSDRRPKPTNPFPENELPRWLLRQALIRSRRAMVAIRAPAYKPLASFSHDLMQYTRSSANIASGLDLCVKPLRDSPIGNRWAGAGDRVRGGATIADALGAAQDLLPPFFLPVIRAGEESGRLEEALAFLHAHCNLLDRPASMLRNVWLLPLAILLAGSAIKVILHLAMDSVLGAIAELADQLISWAKLAIVVALVVLTPARYFVDQMRLSLPLLGALEREIALHRFFRVLALLYSVGGDRVETMIRTAAETVGNHAARIDLLKAARALEKQASVSDAFLHVSLLTAEEKAAIEVGELSGSLETVFDQISDDTGSSMIAKLNFVQPILFRIVTAVVAFSIITTMLSLMF